jgi:hypothetical protein
MSLDCNGSIIQYIYMIESHPYQPLLQGATDASSASARARRGKLRHVTRTTSASATATATTTTFIMARDSGATIEGEL